MNQSAISTLFAAKYSSIDRWSNYGKLFNGYHMRPEYYFILFDFMDGLPPHPNSIKGLESFGEHYEICKLEGMSTDDQAKIITHRINQKSSESIKVVLLDLGDFEFIYKDINGFSLEFRRTILSKTAKTIFDPRQMKENRDHREQKYVEAISCSSIDVEDNAVRSEENETKVVHEGLIQAKRQEKISEPQNDPFKQEDISSRGKQNKERSKKGDGQKKNKAGNGNCKAHKEQNNFDAVNLAVETALGTLFCDAISSFSMPTEENSKMQQSNPLDTAELCLKEEHKSIEKDQITEKIPTASLENEQGGTKQKTIKAEMTPEDAEERAKDAKRKAIERQVFGVGSTSTDHELRYSEYENTRAELINLRIMQFIASVERAIPLLKKKELAYEHYSKLLITFVISDNAQNFMENWVATEPSKDFKIDDQQFFTFKSEAMFIQELSDTLFSDTWVS